ncbi:hypothetical protein SAMN04487866_12525 [Thermoactinomyces sp. DSM 45891]|uniref:hypothetical protein n=1 Tax=Thermoactinomyces sp. DSM 45891 TaxID=1761907 RepID=UPI0009105236|nr:hypothetical protein [Thermoactinomyces sp. DSM 45891]SFX78442.1 hypothetical protein SAMN04487866_12525 [Thermoactinomyces sp. DSM 45891]
MIDLELQQRYEELETRIHRGADYLDNPLLSGEERADELCTEYIRIQKKMKERGMW